MDRSDGLKSMRDRLAHSRDVFLDSPRFAPVRGVFSAAWTIFRRWYPLFASIAVFRAIYAVGFHVWGISVGAWTNTRDYPALRTSVALLLVVIPIWGAVMSVLILIWWVTIPWVVRCTTRMRQGQLDEKASRVAARQALPTHELPLLSGERGSLAEDDEDDSINLDTHLSTGSDEKWLRRVTPTTARWWVLRLVLYLTIAMLGPYLWITREYERDWSHRNEINRAVANATREGAWPGKERIFVAALFHNNQDVLPHWTKQMKRLSAYIGSDNIYFSIMESYSTDSTADLIETFAKDLTSMGVQHHILTHESSIPKKTDTDRRHIRFLAASRNLVMKPLSELADQGRLFDRVLWSNDVFVHAESIVELLETRDKDYDMACGIDFNFFGDAWVLRDKLGSVVGGYWPYFWDEHSMSSVMREEPAPVFACWNGILSVRAEPFYPPRQRIEKVTRLSKKPLEPMLVSGHPLQSEHRATPPFQQPELIFRDSGDNECFSSESFLMPYDLRRRFLMGKIYMVTSVITTYHYNRYVWFKYVLRHWVMRWYVQNVERGYRYNEAKTILGGGEHVYMWDGGHCHGSWFNLAGRHLRRRQQDWVHDRAEL